MNAYVNQETLYNGAHGKENEQLTNETTWMDLKGILLSEKKAILRGHIL